MTELIQFFAVLLAAFGAVSLGWLALGAMVLPGECPGRMVIGAAGDAPGLEQAVRGALWLRRTGLWRGRVVAAECGVSFTGDLPDRI